MATNTEKIVVQVVVQGDKQLGNLEKKTKSTTASFGKMTAAIGAAVVAFRTATKIIGSAIKTFSDFEFEMAKVKAITGSTEKDFKRLTSTAQKLGRTTFFTATQVAELQVAYGKLGFSTTEILAAQEATLQLATATQSDLGRAAVVAGAAVRGFGLDASETQRVVDVMAVSFTSSALDIEKFQTSMTKVAPIANAAGISIESTTAVMGNLTDAGIEASIAGTSLRNIFLKMQDPTSELTKKIGFTVESGEDLEEALKKLNAEGLSNAEMMELVDLRQVAAFATMVNGSERIIELTSALEDANGAAQDMADIMRDTLAGDLIEAQSAFEGLEIAIFTGNNRISKSLRNAVNVWTKLLNNFADELKSTGDVAEEIFGEQVGIAKNQVKELKELAEINKDETIAISLSESMRIAANDLEKELNRLKNVTDDRNGLAKFWDSIAEENIFYDLRTSAGQYQADLPKTIEATEIALADLRAEQKKQSESETAEKKKKELDIFLAQQNSIKNQKKLDDAAAKEKLLKEQKEQREKERLERERLAKEKKDYNESRDALKNALQEELNAEKENLINKEITQAEYDLRAFEAEQGHLELMKELNIIYAEDIAAINGQILDNELEMIAKSAAAEQKKLDDDKKANAEKKKANQEQIDGVAQLGDQLINLAGEDEKMQGIRKAGIQISSAAAIANNLLALSNAAVGVTEQSKLTFPANLVAMATTIGTVISLFANIKALKNSFGDGGVVEAFANGGMVQGKSHANGGEKFAVGGRVVELEGGEAVINKRSTSMFRNQLSAMNSAGGGVKFADGGLLNMPSFSQQQFNALGQNQMMGAMGGVSKVVVVEADITSTQNSVSVIESDAII